jgi:hypothetical protein
MLYRKRKSSIFILGGSTLTGFSTRFRAGSRSGKRSSWQTLCLLSGPCSRAFLKIGLAAILLSLCLAPYSLRWFQPPQIRQLEQPTSRFLQQIGLRARVDVLQLSPLHLLVTANCNSGSQEALARQLRFLYNIDEARGDRLLVVQGEPLCTFRNPCWVIFLAGAGLMLVGYAGCFALINWAQRPAGGIRKRRWPDRLLKLSLLLTIWAVASSALPPLCLPLNLLLLLWWKVRQRNARKRAIVNGMDEAAILLMSFEPAVSASCFKELGPEAVHALTLRISQLPPISPDLREAVMLTFEGLMAAAWRGADRHRCTPAMVCTTLNRFYLHSRADGRLYSASPSGRSLFPSRRWFAIVGSIAILSAAVAGYAFLLVRLEVPEPIRHDLSQFVELSPLAAVHIEREGQTHTLVGLGTDDLNSFRPLVHERAQALGLDPLTVGCLGIRHHQHHFPLRLAGELLLGGMLLLLVWKGRSRPRPVSDELKNPVPDPPPAQAVPAPSEARKPESVVSLMQVDDLTVEVGRGLLGLVDPNQGAKLLERVTGIRRQLALTCGFVLPGVRFRDNLQIEVNHYVISIRGLEKARGMVMVNHFLAIGPEAKLSELRGTLVADPTYGESAKWISPEQRADAERLGVMIFDPVSVVATQLTTVLSENAAEILTFNACLDLFKQTSLAALLDELEMRELDRVRLWKLLRELLRQQVSIRDLTRILEGLILDAYQGASDEELVELARMAVRDSIVRDLCQVETGKPPGPLVLWRVPEELLDLIDGDPQQNCQLLEKFELLSHRMLNAGHQPVVLVEPAYRPSLQKLLMPLKNLRVLSTAELPEWVTLSYFRGEGRL